MSRRTPISVLCVAALTAGLVTVGAGSASAEPEPDAPRCSTGVLPNVVMGSPDLRPGQALGVYLWHTGSGYSLRATHPGTRKVVISGRLTASAGFSRVTKVRFERTDSLTLSADHKTMTFRFTNYGYIDGINFAANCSKLMRVKIRINDAVASPRQIKLGKRRANPTSNPFAIERSTPAPRPSPSPSSATPTATIN
ncbi:MAG: hypothetical protein JJD92_12895 [Frankiaceae bacterium]|nr:hypothetical protein [Frankiaceae bacterium]